MEEILPPPIKSENDRRNYRSIKLSNGLRALLISDSEPLVDPNEEDLERGSSDSGHISENETLDSGQETSDREEESEEEPAQEDDEDEDSDSGDDVGSDVEHCRAVPKEKMAAAALCVGTGSFSDPTDLPGLAHFLEHMLFMGSEKYPDENDFSSYIQKHGGSDNAFTDCERTVYYLEINTKHFKEGLDRFAQFFIAPLMKPDSTERELQAIDSEFSLRMPSDSVRCEHLLGTFSKSDSPLNKFFWGNTESLKTVPESQGIDVQARLRQFYQRHYSSHYMTLVVLSRESLDTLQNWVTEIFSAVPNNGLEPLLYNETEQPFSTPQFTKLYKICPVKQVHRVTIVWSLPSLVKFYKERPLGYLGHIVGHEGNGSLLQFLKKKYWALGLSAGNDENNWDNNCFTSLFSVSINLTESGMDNLEEVLKAVFQYLHLLRTKGPQENIYKEIQLLEENSFRWKDEISAEDYVGNLCQNMQLYSPEDVIRGDTMVGKYDPALIEDCLMRLQPDNCNVSILSNRYKKNEPCDLTDKWMQTSYSQEDIPLDWISTWKKPPLNSELYLPTENLFIATDFDIKMAQEEYNTEFPVKIIDDERSRIWFKKDNKFNVPKGLVYLQLISPIGRSSALNDILMDLYISHLHHNLNPETYPARVASLNYHIYREDNGPIILVTGFNHKINVLLSVVLEHIARFKLDVDYFASLKAQYRKTYYNHFVKPESLCDDLRLSCLEEIYYTSMEKHAVLKTITAEQLKEYAANFTRSLFVEGLIHGNFTPEEALQFDSLIKEKLEYLPLAQELIPELRTMELPNKENYLQVLSFNKENKNSAVTNYYQFGPGTIYSSCLVDLLMELMEEPCFDQLRTKEQLGYSVFCSSRNTFGILGFIVTIHSSADKFGCSHLNRRIEAFLKDFKEHLTQLSDEDFSTHVTTLIKLKNCATLHMQEEARKQWGEILDKTFVFDRVKKETECLKKLTLEEFRRWALNAVALGLGDGPKLGFQVVGPGSVALAECVHSTNNNKDLKSKLENHAIVCNDANENGAEYDLAESDSNPSNPNNDDEHDRIYDLQFRFPKRNPDDVRFIRDIASFKKQLRVLPVWKIAS